MNKLLKIVFVSALIIVALLYALITMLQSADAATINIAKEVDAFVIQYCENNNDLPASRVLQSQFPNLNSESGWIFYSDDKSWLRVQYPMRWWNKDMIGEQRISEFTATVSAYAIEYKCKQAKL